MRYQKKALRKLNDRTRGYDQIKASNRSSPPGAFTQPGSRRRDKS